MKFVVTCVIVAFLIFYVATSPSQAAGIVHGAWHGAATAAHGVGGFLNKLAS